MESRGNPKSKVEHRRHSHYHHPALADVEILLGKANIDLASIENHIDKEFQASYPSNVNPSRILARLKKVKEDIEMLKDNCREIICAKQEFIDNATATLVDQKVLLERLLASAGLPIIADSAQVLYTNLDQVISEWKTQMGVVKTGDEKHDDLMDINSMLASAKIEGV